MNPSVFDLSHLEFQRFEVDANPEFALSESRPLFPQIGFEFNNVKFEIGSDLVYPDSELLDPRHFTFSVKLSIRQSKQDEGVLLPYSVTIEGRAYLHFRGKNQDLERFKYVRGTGYSMLYGAFREQIANFTARSVHGLWFLPTANFNSQVEAEALKDFSKWQAALSAKPKKVGRARAKTSKVKATEKDD